LKKQERIFGLDLMRFLAISSVLYCHLSSPLYHFFSGYAEVIFNLLNWITGYYGVEIFFVLSGFLIGSIYIKTIVNSDHTDQPMLAQVKDFWLKRWIRTLPNYYLFILINLVVYTIVHTEINTAGVLKAILFLQKVQPKASVSFFGVSWSLAVEEWFYLLMPIFFMIGLSFMKDKKRAFGLAIFLLFFIPTFNKFYYAIQSKMPAKHDEVFRYATFYRIDAIGFGVLFSWFWSLGKYREFFIRHKTKLLIAGIGLLLFSFLYILLFLARNDQNPFLFAAFSSICSVAILLCMPALIQMKARAGSIFYKSVVFVSLSSYSLYLCHGVVIQLIAYFFEASFHLETFPGAILYVFTLLTTSLLFAHFLYKYFEVPILNKRESIIKYLKK
jgi:peptidoglycan/LPS O-acetylase OafA/YrhL